MAGPTTQGEKPREAELRGVVARTDRRNSAFPRDALKDGLVHAEIDAIRKRVAPLAEAQGWVSDEDVFREIS